MWGEDSQARALEILGVRRGPDGIEALGESRPASVEDLLSGVEVSMLDAKEWSGMLRAKNLVAGSSILGETARSASAEVLWVLQSNLVSRGLLLRSTGPSFLGSHVLPSQFNLIEPFLLSQPTALQ